MSLIIDEITSDKIRENEEIERRELEGTTEEVITNLNKAIAFFKKKHPTCKELRFDIETALGYDDEIEVNFILSGQREKNDKDLLKEKKIRRWKKKEREEEYNRLKKEFGGNTKWVENTQTD